MKMYSFNIEGPHSLLFKRSDDPLEIEEITTYCALLPNVSMSLVESPTHVDVTVLWYPEEVR